MENGMWLKLSICGAVVLIIIQCMGGGRIFRKNLREPPGFWKMPL